MIRSAVSLVPWWLRGRIRNIPGVAHVQRWAVKAALDGQEFVHRVDAGPARGVRFRIRMPEDKGIWTGTYEQSFAERIAAATPRDGVAYDIGGWHGFFTGVMATNGARKVVVFEPLPANIERIQQLVCLNPDLPIELQPMALGKDAGEAELVLMPDTSMAKLAVSSFQADRSAAERIRVQVGVIDDLVASGALPPPDLMKLDVEGAELMVLKGARQVLRAHRPVIFAEVHSSAILEEVRAMMDEHDYDLQLIDEDMEAARKKDVFQVEARPRAGAAT